LSNGESLGAPIFAMNRLAIWPNFRDDWIVYADAHIVVVNKPEGVPSQAADPERPDDIVWRLRAYFGAGAYVGTHQRLDQDTSGLLVFARRKDANASLAEQFEGRSVKKTYVACVTGWPRRRDHATLRSAIERGQGKAMRVSKRGGPDAKPAVTRATVRERCQDRAMLELELETGRTHQARVQLSYAGSPIAGDPLYGGSPAPRLMLHASAIELRHPGDGRPVRFTSPPPPEFAAWLARGDTGEAVYDDDAVLVRTLSRAVERRWGLGRCDSGPRATTAFRLANEEGDGLPRLAIDVYGNWLCVQFRGDDGPWADRARRERVLDRVHALGFDGVYSKVRAHQLSRCCAPKQVSVSTVVRTGAGSNRLAPSDPVRGSPAPSEISILEEGVPLLVRLGEGLSTGLFLDQRANRQRVRAAAAGKAVANLFAYTCAFTVEAALGGARRTVSIDASAVALERGSANLKHAGVEDDGKHTFVRDDAFAWLKRAMRRGESWDLIVLDPPSYSTTKRGRFVAEDDYISLASSAMGILATGGRFLACTNHRGISRARFRNVMFEAGRAAGREVTQVKDLPVASDYPVPPGGEDHMKSVWVSCQ
jgi:23S rRNA (cytosine1962-C5)-methyltransferase